MLLQLLAQWKTTVQSKEDKVSIEISKYVFILKKRQLRLLKGNLLRVLIILLKQHVAVRVNILSHL